LKEHGTFKQDTKPAPTVLKEANLKRSDSIFNVYDVGPIIGDASYSRARIARHKVTKIERAVKMIDKSTIVNP